MVHIKQVACSEQRARAVGAIDEQSNRRFKRGDVSQVADAADAQRGRDGADAALQIQGRQERCQTFNVMDTRIGKIGVRQGRHGHRHILQRRRTFLCVHNDRVDGTLILCGRCRVGDKASARLADHPRNRFTHSGQAFILPFDRDSVVKNGEQGNLGRGASYNRSVRQESRVRDISASTESLIRSIESNPLDVQAYCKLASSYQAAGAFGKAELTLLRAIEVGPLHHEAWVQLGRLYVDQGEWRAAADIFEHASKLVPDDPTSWIGLGLMRIATKDMLGAAEVRGRCWKSFPTGAKVI